MTCPNTSPGTPPLTLVLTQRTRDHVTAWIRPPPSSITDVMMTPPLQVTTSTFSHEVYVLSIFKVEQDGYRELIVNLNAFWVQRQGLFDSLDRHPTLFILAQTGLQNRCSPLSRLLHVEPISTTFLPSALRFSVVIIPPR